MYLKYCNKKLFGSRVWSNQHSNKHIRTHVHTHTHNASVKLAQVHPNLNLSILLSIIQLNFEPCVNTPDQSPGDTLLFYSYILRVQSSVVLLTMLRYNTSMLVRCSISIVAGCMYGMCLTVLCDMLGM